MSSTVPDLEPESTDDMYRSYYNRYNRDSSNYRFSYPNYGYTSSYRRPRFGPTDYDSSPYWNELFYGTSRRRPYYWDRDRSIDLRTRSRSRTTGSTEGNDRAEDVPETPPPKPEPPKEELAKVLHVKQVDYHIPQNTVKHKTDDYECTKDRKLDGKEVPAELVVRRGDSFKATLTLDRPYSDAKNDLLLLFSIGEKPLPSRGTEARVSVDESGEKDYEADEWGANKISASGNDVTLMVFVPANCIVGEWSLAVRTYAKGKDDKGNDTTKIYRYEHDQDFTVLFNPWCPADGTYMATKDLLEEYVLNPSGCVYRGNAWTIGAKEWNFGQFEEEILDAALYLMRKGFNTTTKAMADPIKVCRALAKMVNVQDDNGVLVGNWSGNYEDGVSPSKWVGSVKILRQFMESGPVQYGQCWVFSCVTTTVCRALGIPCRTVTNFSSAHDTDESNTIDKYFQRNEKGILEKVSVDWSSDSVWNFHVWNEVWLERQDLNEKGYNGWQVIDATPQETSEGVFTCGPCPLAAIKKGICDVKYDTGFVFAEVNADEVHWEILPDGDHRRIKLKKTKIGANISTKIPDGKPYREYASRWVRDLSEKKRLDITHEYKFPEGSEEERRSVMMAHKTARHPLPNVYEEPEKVEHVEFKLEHSNEILVGSDLPVELTAKNNGRNEVNITMVEFRVSPKTYTGETGKVFFRKMLGPERLASGKSTNFKAKITVNDYLPNLIEMASLYIEATAVVAASGNAEAQTTLKAHDFRFRRPDLTVECPETANVGDEVTFEVSFTNPLPVPMTKCDISMESSGFTDIADQPVPDVPAKGEFKKTFKLKARKPKVHAVVFSFDCKTLKDITGSASITIKK